MPGAFKLDHLQPVKPILFYQFSKIFTFILERPILITPERGRLKMGKWNSHNLSVRVVFLCLGHSNWTICSLLSQFCFVNFTIFHSFILGANSYYPRGGKTENGKMEFSQPGYESGISVPGAFKLDHLLIFKPILFPKFSNFFTFILGRPILITPERGRLKMGKWNSPNLSVAQVF